MAQPASETATTTSTTDPPGGGRSPVLVWTLRGAGVAVAVAVYLALGAADMSADARTVAAVASLMAVWWMTEAIPLAVTALLPIALFPVLTERTVEETTAPYANDIVFLFMGGFLIAIAMQKWHLHRRIALRTLTAVGTHPRRIVLGMMIATAFLSMWVSNTATTLMMLPIGLSILALMVQHDPRTGQEKLVEDRPLSETITDPDVRTFSVALVLSIAWGASIGGLGTLLGSPPNAIVAGYLADEVGADVGFLEWMMLGVPLVVVFLLVAWLLITRLIFRFQLDEIAGGHDLIHRELHDLGTMSRGEKVVLVVFVSAAFLWIVPGLLANIGGLGERLPWLDLLPDSVIAIAAGVSLFLIPAGREGGMALTWHDAERGLPWGVLLLFGGGLSLASAVAGTGLDEWFGQQVQGLGALPSILLLAAVCTLVLLLTEMTSNTGTAATFIPVLGGVAVGIGMDHTTLLIPAALAATCAFMLPVGTPPNAIVFGSGLVRIAEMVRGGVVLNVVGVVLITLATVAIGPFALGMVL